MFIGGLHSQTNSGIVLKRINKIKNLNVIRRWDAWNNNRFRLVLELHKELLSICIGI